MPRIHLAFLWHQHQPYYKDIIHGNYVLPWVRLHALKDYIGLLLVIKEFPEIRMNINLAPVLLAQLQEYADGKAEDIALQLTRIPAEDLTEAQAKYILEHFFAGNARRIVQPYPRYSELYDIRRIRERTASDALPDFNSDMLRDLQIWHTLAWFHPLLVESYPEIKALHQKQRDFREEDKETLFAAQSEILKRVIPFHREMLESGQIELSTTPFYHPILPLLVNMECAREALHDLPMPERRSDFKPDAETHVARAMELHRKLFGQEARGLWPAEGSVSMDILPLLKKYGIRWMATDEQILGRSMGVNLQRDHTGCLVEPDGLCQPYRAPGGNDMPAIFFRDRVLADTIGFEYHHGDSRVGAENFAWRVAEIGRRCHGSPRIVPVILDGENPWEYYEQSGLPFLRELFARLSKNPDVKTTRLSDYLDEHPPERSLERLAAGSWIEANFAVWIGSPAHRQAWSMVAEARDALQRRENAKPPLSREVLKEAWESIYVAEGSDWCWWLGGDRTSDQDYMFDELFRSHLRNMYNLIGVTPPLSLALPIGKPPAPHRHVAGPEGDNPAMRRSGG